MVTKVSSSKEWVFDPAKAQSLCSASSELALALDNCALRMDGFKTFDYIPKTWLSGGPTKQQHEAFLHFAKSGDVEKIVSDSVSKCDELLKTEPGEIKALLTERWHRNNKNELGAENPDFMSCFVDAAFQKIKETSDVLKELKKEIGTAMKTQDMDEFSDTIENILDNVKKIDKVQVELSDFLYVLAHGPDGVGVRQFLDSLRK